VPGSLLAHLASQGSLTDPIPQGGIPIPNILPPRIAFANPNHPTFAPAPSESDDVASSDASPQTFASGGLESASDSVDDWTWQEIADTVFDAMALPCLDSERTAPGSSMTPDTPEPQSRPGGPWDRRHTLLAHLTRRAHAGTPSVGLLDPTDIRYRAVTSPSLPSGGAVLIAMMDTSGSMGPWEKNLAKTLLFWTTQFLMRHYPRVQLVFIAHDVRAKELSESEFFQRGASGGTLASAAFRLALDILDARFPVSAYNRYGMYLSDGGNLKSDNPKAQALAAHLTTQLNLFAVGEIHDTEQNPSALYTALGTLPIRTAILRSDHDLIPTLHTFFHP
jgi:hypothetical protein